MARGLLPKPVGAPLVAALLTGLAVWLLGPGRPGLSAAPQLPPGPPGRQVAWIGNGDPLNPIPREPMAVAALEGGDLLVADAGLGQVHRYGSNRQLLRSYGEGRLRYPVGLAVAEDGRAWVADLWQRRVFRLDLAGNSLEAVPPEPSGYQGPVGLAYRQGLLYLTDVARHQVLVLSPDGGLVRAIGTGRGKESGEFAYPNGVWVAEDGEVFVSDSNNGRIQVFDAEGRFQRTLQPHRLLQPRGLVQDSRGRLHVADTQANDIAVLDPAGHILGRYGTGEELASPTGLALRGQVLYVADRGNGRVIAWELGDEP
ncbi:MAG: hypothetical protein HY690_10940 [Chloroflexi bacterium]|nr:hypothetical protein [Chloroflexota bacterium]